MELKGSVARQISNHELLLTQLLLDNALTDLRPEEIVALLSCTVCQVRTQVEPQLPSVLQKVSGRERAAGGRSSFFPATVLWPIGVP